MKPYIHYKLGASYVVWICECSYFENEMGTVTAYTGGEISG